MPLPCEPLQRFLCSKTFMVGLILTIAVLGVVGASLLVAKVGTLGRVSVGAGGVMSDGRHGGLPVSVRQCGQAQGVRRVGHVVAASSDAPHFLHYRGRTTGENICPAEPLIASAGAGLVIWRVRMHSGISSRIDCNPLGLHRDPPWELSTKAQVLWQGSTLSTISESFQIDE